MPDFHPSEADDKVFPELFGITPVPSIGERVRLVLRNDSMMLKGPWAHLCPSTVRLVGNVIGLPPGEHFDPTSMFGLWVADEPVPHKVIRMSNVHSINGARVRLTPTRQTPQYEDTVVEVSGSKGDVYRVECRRGKWTCDCKGFGFRHTCRHISEAAARQNALQGA